jgi:predicted CxxxxCH...CXXCH cytochrome family protein
MAAPMKLVKTLARAVLVAGAMALVLAATPAAAQVGVGTAWTSVNTGTTGATLSGAFTKPTGTNQLMVVAVVARYSVAVTLPTAPTVSYGGQAATSLTSTTASSLNKVWTYFLTAAQVTAATTTTLAVAGISTTNLSASAVYAGSFTNVAQLTPQSDLSANQTTTAAASITFGKNVAWVVNGRVFYVASTNSTTATTTLPTGYSRSPADTSIQATFRVGGAYQTAAQATASSANTSVTLSPSVLAAIGVVALQPYSAPAVPAAPTFGAGSTATSVVVNWATATGATTYDVQRAPDAAGSPGTWANVATGVAGLTFTDSTGIAGNTTFWYRIVAKNASDAIIGTQASYRTIPLALVNAPAVTAGASTESSVAVTWTAPAGGAATYSLDWSTSNVFTTFTTVSGIATTGTTVSGLAANTTYYLRVQPVNATGAQPTESATGSGTTAPAVPAAPSFASVTASSLAVNWSAVAGATGYRVERAPDVAGVAGTYAQVGTPATNTFPDTGLTASTAYWYRVASTSAAGASTAGPGASVTTTAALPVTSLVVGDGTNPGDVAPLCPGGTATPLDAFTLQATGAADVVTRISVQLAPAGAWVNVAKVEILDAGSVVLSSAVPGGDTVNVYVGSLAQAINVTSSYTVRITPNSHAAMPAPNAGQQYAVTGTVTSVASNNPRSYLDTASATVTIDNLAPGEVAWSGVTTGTSNIQLNWGAAVDVVVLRKQGGPVTETPVDGTTYAANAILGGSTVACSGSMLLCNSTGLTATTAYYFKVFTRDACGNYSLGSPVGPLFPGGVNEGNPNPGTLVPVVAILNPMNAAVVTNTAAGFRVQVRAFSRMNGATSQPISAVRLKVANTATTFGATCDATNYPLLLTLSTRYPSSSAAATDNHGIYETTLGTTQLGASTGAFTLRACAVNSAGTVFSGLVGVTVKDGNPGSPKGDGNLLVRDNSAQLCTDCHNLPTHSAEAVGNTHGSWHADCRDCHTPHSTTNVELIRKQITPPGVAGPQPPRTVIFSNRTTGFSATGGAANVGAAAFANGDGTGVCQVCHTRTSYYLANGTLTTHNPTQACTSCHAHDKGLKASCTACHGDRAGTYVAIAGADSLANAAPPYATTNATTGVKVGAHQPHVNGKAGAATYRTAPLACASCHPIPNTHNGTRDAAWSVLATNTIINGVATAVAPTPAAGLNAYTTAWEGTPTCTNACHGANLPSNAAKPVANWSGGALTCASCHGQSAAAPQPALSATANQTHPQNTACSLCHGAGYAVAAVNKATHIDGTLTRTTSGCTACHGDLGVAGVTLTANLAAAAPGQTGGVNSMDTTGATATTAPGVGAHLHHLTTTIYRGPVACTECHALPPSATDTTHATGVSTSGSRATLTWGALARGVGVAFNNELVAPTYTGSTSAAYGAAAGSCASTYCHGQFKNGAKATIAWNATGITCNGCHGRSAGAIASEPGGSHPFPAAACGSCHAGYTATTVAVATHVNGVLDVNPMTCTSCHGDATRVAAGTATELDPLGTARLVLSSPPKDTAGLLTGSNQVGAHLQHVNQGAAAPALSSPLRCVNCHTVPTVAVHSTGSVGMAWGNVAVAGGATPSYTAASHTCSSTYCHGNFSGGLGANPIPWGNGTQVKRACNGCHGQSVAAPQPNYPHPQNTTCATCHGAGYSTTTVVATTHVDGLVTKSTAGCTACHGELGAPNVTLANLTVKAAPGASLSANSYDTTGLAIGNVIGAHEAHLVGVGVGNTPRWRSTAIACTECHALPASNTDTSHATGLGTGGARATIAFGNLAQDAAFETKVAAYTRYTCSNTYCHNPKNADTASTPVAQVKAPAWNGVTAQAQCGSCHGLPPAGTSHPANALCGSCHPGYTATAPTAASTITAVNAALHINGQLDGGESSGATPCLNCHKTDAATGAKYSMMVSDTTVYHHVVAEGTVFKTYPVTAGGQACLQCHADHDVFTPTLNAANTLGRGANLRTTIATAPTKVAPATGNYANTDFSGTAGICLSCHATSQAKSTTAQKSYAGTGNTLTHAIVAANYSGSAHAYSVNAFISSGNSLVQVSCVKCHSDAQTTTYPEKQSGTWRFALHTSVDRRLRNPMGMTVPADNMEEKFCFRCHALTTDATPGGGPVKGVANRDYFNATAMTVASQNVYLPFTAANEISKHNVAGYSGVHMPDETQANIAATLHVECEDCHDVHAVKPGLHVKGSNVAGGVLFGSPAQQPTMPTTVWANTVAMAYTSVTVGASTPEAYVCFRCHSSANTAIPVSPSVVPAAPWNAGAAVNGFTNTALEFSTANRSYHPVLGALPTGVPGTTGSNQLAVAQLCNASSCAAQAGGFQTWTPGQLMTCTDCHNADAVSPAAQGPHGSAVRFMLSGVNRAWPFTSAASNGAASGTAFRLNTSETGIGTTNGLFCRNCHPVPNSANSNAIHTQSGLNSGTHASSAAIAACVACHIRVPHGGKVSRLMVTTNAPARYKVGTPNLVGFIRTAKGSYTLNANLYMQSSCTGKHIATPTGTEAW